MWEGNFFDVTNTTIEKYRLYLFQYGIITMIYLIDHFELLEEYEECEKIKQSILYQNKRLDLKLPTRMEEYLFDEIRDMYPKDKYLTNEWMENTYMYYKDIVLKEITAANSP